MDFHHANRLIIVSVESLSHSRGQTILRGPAILADGTASQGPIKAIAHIDTLRIAEQIRAELTTTHTQNIDPFLRQEIENAESGHDHDFRDLRPFSMTIRLYASKMLIGSDLANNPVFQYVIDGMIHGIGQAYSRIREPGHVES